MRTLKEWFDPSDILLGSVIILAVFLAYKTIDLILDNKDSEKERTHHIKIETLIGP